MNNIDYILEQIRSAYPGDSDHDKRGRGDAFERLIRAYLANEPSMGLSDVTLWGERHYDKDLGVDLEADSPLGKVAIQCKFWKEGGKTLCLNDLNNFLLKVLLDKSYKQCILVDTTGLELHEDTKTTIEDLKKHKPFSRITLDDLRSSKVDLVHFWDSEGEIRLHDKKQMRPYQQEGIDAGIQHFQSKNRGKMIMACGTGKTFVSLRLAEAIVGRGGHVLFLVPSLALMSQTIEKWQEDGDFMGVAIPVCSRDDIARDTNTYLATSEDSLLADMNRKEFVHATTNPEELAANFQKFTKEDKMNVVFCTYQSSKQIAVAQAKHGLSEFDLIICDEAHKTTGLVKEHQFTLVHDQTQIKGKYRLYMTATPRIIEGYVDKTHDGVLYSMDDKDKFGKTFFQYGFTTAIEDGWLKQYEIVALELDVRDIPDEIKSDFPEEDGELIDVEKFDRIIGCQKALCEETGIKRMLAFHQRIKNSSLFAEKYKKWVGVYNKTYPEEALNKVDVSVEHIDGGYSVSQRNNLLNWLKGDVPEGECRMVSNARVFIEGVDVPALNAIIFVEPKSAHVDVIQSIGRVLRPPHGRQIDEDDAYADRTGLIFIPIVKERGKDTKLALNMNKRYATIIKVLQELALNDDLLIEKMKLDKILRVGAGGGGGKEPGSKVESPEKEYADEVSLAIEHVKTTVTEFKKRVDKKRSTQYGHIAPLL